MSTLKQGVVFFSLLMMPALATSKSKVDLTSTQLILSIYNFGKYSKEFSKIYESHHELICKTELEPYYPLKKINKEELLSLSNDFYAESKKNKSLVKCERNIKLKLQNKELVALCSDNKIALKLVGKLSKDCGR
jgi:hypothetical protein